MKFAIYINELADDLSGAAKLIERDCQPFLKEARQIWFKRGTKKNIKSNLRKFKARSDRQPKDTPRWLHNIFDEAFKKKFGWKARSEGVFASASTYQSEVYGKSYLIFPIGDFKFVYSHHVVDLFDDLTLSLLTGPNRDNTDIVRDYALSWMHAIREWINFKTPGRVADMDAMEIVKHTVDLIVKTYTDKNLSLIYHNNEVAFNCYNYYLVNPVYENSLRRQLK
jgi:hypothetical protein